MGTLEGRAWAWVTLCQVLLERGRQESAHATWTRPFLMEVLWALVSICHQAGSESYRPRECEDGINFQG